MSKKRLITVAAVLIAATAALFASGATETDKLWFYADKVADNSVLFLPGTRTIELQTFDASGDVLKTSASTVYQTPVNYGRYIENRITGDTDTVELLNRFFDGGVLTPFEDNLYDMDYDAVGTEIINGRTCTVYEVNMAFDSALLTYDPVYRASGEILGWNSDDDDFDDAITATIWVDQETNALVKLVNKWKINDVMSKGKLSIIQTVEYEISMIDAEVISLPSTITTTGKLTQRQDGSGYYTVTDFAINEVQSDFFYNEKFARGEIVD